MAKRVAKKRPAKRRVAKKRVAKKRVAKKRPAKKRVAKKRVAKKAPAKRRAAKKRVAKKKAALPAGYKKRRRSGLIVPQGVAESRQPVPAKKLRRGFARAQEQIVGFATEVMESLQGEFSIREIEFQASFNADGKFLGFGVGGAASVTIRIAPEP